MKDHKRLAAGVQLGNTPTGVIMMHVVDFDGGDFNLQPKLLDEGAGVIMVDPTRPSAYGLQLSGEPEALKRLANTLMRMAKAQSGDDDAEPRD